MKDWRTSCIPANRRSKRILRLLLLSALAAGILSMSLGSALIPPARVLRALWSGGRGVDGQIVLYVRLPRTCGCLLAGMALAVSGTVIQSVLNNPLAAPNIIGVNAGAGFAVTLGSLFLPVAAASGAAFAGALAAALLVLLIAEKTGASRITLVLAGVAVSSVFAAGIDAVITLVPDALTGYTDFRIGGMANLTLSRLGAPCLIVLPGFALLMTLTNELDILMLGGDMARSLGLPAKALRLIFLTLAAALAGAAVSFSGLIGFVGLIVPHMMRCLVGEGSRVLLPAAALGGATFLTLCDLLARLVFMPYELPVGILLSLVGGPFFIWLLLRQRKGRIHD